MKLCFKSDVAAVFDDCFFDHEADRIAENLPYEEKFRFVQSGCMDKVYAIGDGNFLEGEGYISSSARFGKSAIENSSISSVVKKIESSIELFSSCVGEKGKDWSQFTARAFCFPKGTGLTWHDDGSQKTGAYIYYAHRHWDANWGGELMLSSSPMPNVRARYAEEYGHLKPEIFNRKRESEYLLETGFGHFIAPKPNRLVVFRSGTYHKIKRVEDAAGDHIRMSVSGFFLK